MPRASRLVSCSAALILADGLSGAGLGLAAAESAGAATSWPAHVFAPYVDTGLSNTTLTTVAADYGTKYFTLAFVNGSGCQWSLPNQSGWQSQISALQAEGGDVSISFGGYTADTDGTDLGATCSSASAMATQVESVVTTLGVTHLDFDIESSEETNSADFTRTAQALAQVRSWASGNGKQLTISYTLPVLPTGFTQDGLNVLNAATASGFTPNIVNIMTMDYGTSGGNTPMIGQNDPARRPPAAASARAAAPSPRRSSRSAAARAAAEAVARRPPPRHPRRPRPAHARRPGATPPLTFPATRSPTTAATGPRTSGTTTRFPAVPRAPGTATAPADRPSADRRICRGPPARWVASGP